jgi:hypothetical protein
LLKKYNLNCELNVKELLIYLLSTLQQNFAETSKYDYINTVENDWGNYSRKVR